MHASEHPLGQPEGSSSMPSSNLTGRERLTRILHGGERDRPAWTTLIDETTRSSMPDESRSVCHLDFYRRIGCDVLLLGPWGLPEHQRPIAPCRLVMDGVDERWSVEDGCQVHVREDGSGRLVSAQRSGHPVRYPVSTIDDVRTLRRMWEATRCEEPADGDQGLVRAKEAVGDLGLYAEAMVPSPVQHLIETEMGHAGFYYLLADHRREVEALLDVMHARRLAEYEAVARHTVADVVIPIENTSTLLTSPAIYARYCLPQLRDYVSVLHRHGHKVVLHMCGHLKALLPMIRETGLDGINGLTPPPVGDTTYAGALDAFGEEFVILGGVFPPEVLHGTALTYEDLSAALDDLYTPRLRRARFLLWIAVDGLPTELRRFEMVGRWMGECGSLDGIQNA